MTKRLNRLNSLLKEVISEVIHREVRDPRLHPLATITNVSISPDLKQARVYVSVLGTEEQRESTLKALRTASGFIALCASQKITIRFFPMLSFRLDTTVDEQMRVDALLTKIKEKSI